MSAADVAELADAQASGACALRGVEVRLLSSALAIGIPRTTIGRQTVAKGRDYYWLDSHNCGRNSVVECQLPKLDVGGSNPLARFLSSYHFPS